MKKIFSKEFVIGASVIIALAILFFGIDYLKGINLFKPANFYYVSYDNVAGLEVAAPVTIDGFKVGQVREIEYNYEHPGKIKVLLALDRKLHLKEGTSASIVPSMLSGASISLHLGNGSNMIPVGGEVAASSEKDMISTLTDEIVPKATNVIEHVDTVLLNLNALLSSPALSQSIGRLDGISYNLLGTSATLNKQLSANTPRLFSHMNRIAYNLDTVTADLSKFSGTLNNLPLDKTMDNVNELLARLTQFSEQLNNDKSTLGKLMNDPELYNQLSRVSADVDSLIVDIKRNPKRYISIKLL